MKLLLFFGLAGLAMLGLESYDRFQRLRCDSYGHGQLTETGKFCTRCWRRVAS